MLHNAAAHTAHGIAIGQNEHFCAHIPRSGAVPRNNGSQHRRSAGFFCLYHCIQQCDGIALGLGAGILDLHDLRQNGKRDLRSGLRADGKADGGAERIDPLTVQTVLQQLTAHQCSTTTTAHHAHIGRRLLQDLGKAIQIKSVGAGQYRKIGLCPAWHILKRLCKGGTKHSVCSGGAQLLGKFFPVVYGKHRQVKKLCLFYKGSSHMAAAADYQLRHGTKALGKYSLPVQCQKARSGTGLQDGKLTLQKFGVSSLPHGVAVPQQQLTACLCAFQHGSQRIAAGLVCILQNVCKRLSVHWCPSPSVIAPQALPYQTLFGPVLPASFASPPAAYAMQARTPPRSHAAAGSAVRAPAGHGIAFPTPLPLRWYGRKARYSFVLLA